MKRTKEYELMRCVDCGTEYPYPIMFPVPIYAECWKCCWDRHIQQSHPPTRRDKKLIKRRVRKQLKTSYLAELNKNRTATLIRSEVVSEQTHKDIP